MIFLDYVAIDHPDTEYQTIPLDKIDDFGVHAKQYLHFDLATKWKILFIGSINF